MLRFALFVSLVVGCRGYRTLPAGSAEQPDVVLISIDTLRADHVGTYGYSRPTTPFIDGLAANGVRFAAARSASPWTLPSHTTMLSGQLPSTHMVVEDDLSLDASVPVLPEVYKAAGYATGGFVSTLYVSELYGFQRGFDTFEDFGIHGERQNLEGEVDAEDVISKALGWAGGLDGGQPLFLFLHFYDVHYQYDPPGDYGTLFDRAPVESDARFKNYFVHKKKPLSAEQMAHQVAQYDEELRYVDDQLARLAKALHDAGRKVRWVVTADHGEEFGERGSWGHAHTLFAEQLHVPLIVSGPDISSGAVVTEPVGTQDIAPTLAGWVDRGAELRADGIDLAPSVRTGAAAPTGRCFPAETTRFDTNRLGILHGGLRLEWDLGLGRTWLFDEATDPAEQHDISNARHEDVARLQEELVACIGTPWTANTDGKVAVHGGALLPGAGGGEVAVTAGQHFAVVPYDTWLSFQPPGGERVGDWAAVGGTRPPEGAPLTFTATSGATTGVELDAEARARLEALGYMQPEGEE